MERELTKTVIVELTLREGEREFSLKPFSKVVDAGLSDDEIVDETIRDFYGEPTEVNDKGWYFYDNSEYAIYLTRVVSVSQKDFDIVSKFI